MMRLCWKRDVNMSSVEGDLKNDVVGGKYLKMENSVSFLNSMISGSKSKWSETANTISDCQLEEFGPILGLFVKNFMKLQIDSACWRFKQMCRRDSASVCT